jgi:multidrug efflux pump subunit AcrA (membrane-fusion protein)
VVPLHTWLPDAHTQAPTAGSVILAAILLKFGTYGYLRFGLYLLPDAAAWAAPVMLTLGVIGITYGAICAAMQKDLADYLYYNETLTINVHPDLGLAQDPDEDEREFRIRLQQAARERRDAEVDKLQKQAEKQIAAVDEKLRKAQQSLNEAQSKAQAKQTEQWVNIGESVLNFFSGRSTRRAVSSATSKWNQASAAAANVEETKQNIAELTAEKEKLTADLQAQVQEITNRWETTLDNIQTDSLKPKRTDISVQAVTLGWAPLWQVVYDANGSEQTTTVPGYKSEAS